jgi:hypothetical protein
MKKSGPFDRDVSVVCGVCEADEAGRGAPPGTSVEITKQPARVVRPRRTGTFGISSTNSFAERKVDDCRTLPIWYRTHWVRGSR